ncbi:GMC oxidoreductase [Polyporus arcularius HHB13444]|uniref:GMC oxidoreductase n=1 Tax=Polyporus arcularius HHB13444 TaxID=1314778 RepID=A0A5C3P9C2_9APHY|nr:GMC oxidoreductase [Polyporus arcularius HHB13444]
MFSLSLRRYLALGYLVSLAQASCDNQAPLDPGRFSRIEYDYIIIGGGTAGIALSARLAEDPSLVIGVIEAGTSHAEDPLVDIPSSSVVGNATYDWNFVSTSQRHAQGRRVSLPRGKMLGGSSGINGLAWGRASKPEYDSWSVLSGDGTWSWKGLLPYMQKAENFSAVPTNPYPGISGGQKARVSHDIPQEDGYNGPIHASYNSVYFQVVSAVVETLNGLGVKTNAEPQSGDATGVFNTLVSVDREEGVRSYAASTYYCSRIANRNYRVLTDAMVTKILFAKSEGPLTAIGVEFSANGQLFNVFAKKEVVLAAGAVQTPQLLELSGIGNRTLLQSHGITTLVDLPGVGENLQEHLFSGVQFKLKQGIQTFDLLRSDPAFAAEQRQIYQSTRGGLLAATDNAFTFLSLKGLVSEDRLHELLALFDLEDHTKSTGPLLRKQNALNRRWFTEDNVATVELIQLSRGIFNPTPNSSYVTIQGGIVHPSSRGSVHITTQDAFVAPEIDPAFLSRDFDTEVLLDIIKYIQLVAQTEPLASMVEEQTDPVPDSADDEIIRYIRAGSGVCDEMVHGTAAMASREDGGVVDGSLRVHGTANLRVVDASIIPIQMACHTQQTVYAIAEKAADMIKNQHIKPKYSG